MSSIHRTGATPRVQRAATAETAEHALQGREPTQRREGNGNDQRARFNASGDPSRRAGGATSAEPTSVKRGVVDADDAQAAQGATPSSSPIGQLIQRMEEQIKASPELAASWGPYMKTLQDLDRQHGGVPSASSSAPASSSTSPSPSPSPAAAANETPTSPTVSTVPPVSQKSAATPTPAPTMTPTPTPATAPPVQTPVTVPAQTTTSPVKPGTFSGEGTFYNPGVGLSADGKLHQDSEMVVALNAAMFGNNPDPANDPVMGQKIKVSGPNGDVVVTVTDKLPSGAANDLDLSPAAFDKIADRDAGRVPITWSFV